MSTEAAAAIASAVIAGVSAVISVAAVLSARAASKSSDRSADASERSAKAAEDSVAFEREALLFPTVYHEESIAGVDDAVGSLEVRNHGRGAARDIVVEVDLMTSMVMGSHPSALAGETVRVITFDYRRPVDDPQPHDHLTHRARVSWTSLDGREHQTDWTIVEWVEHHPGIFFGGVDIGYE